MNISIMKIILILLLIGMTLPTYSQTQLDNFKITSERIIREKKQVSISMNLILDDMNINRNDMLILTPTLKSNGTNKEKLSLPPIVIAGKLRNKILSRKKELGNRDQFPFEDEPQFIINIKNNIQYNILINPL